MGDTPSEDRPSSQLENPVGGAGEDTEKAESSTKKNPTSWQGEEIRIVSRGLGFAALIRLSNWLFQSLTYWLAITMLLWLIAIGTVIEHASLKIYSFFTFMLVCPCLLLGALDYKRMWIPLRSVENIYVIALGLILLGLIIPLGEKNPLTITIYYCVTSIASSLIVVMLEVANLPYMVYIMIMPAVTSLWVLILLQFYLTGTLGLLSEDILYHIGSVEVSTLNTWANAGVVFMNLMVSKILKARHTKQGLPVLVSRLNTPPLMLKLRYTLYEIDHWTENRKFVVGMIVSHSIMLISLIAYMVATR